MVNNELDALFDSTGVYSGGAPKYVQAPAAEVVVNVPPPNITASASEEPINIAVPLGEITVHPIAAALNVNAPTEDIIHTISLPDVNVTSGGVSLQVDPIKPIHETLQPSEFHVSYDSPEVKVEAPVDPINLNVSLEPVYVDVSSPSVDIVTSNESVSYAAPARPIVIDVVQPTLHVTDVAPVNTTISAQRVQVTVEAPTTNVPSVEPLEVPSAIADLFVTVPSPVVTMSETPENITQKVKLPPVNVLLDQQEVYVQVPEGPSSYSVPPQNVQVSVPEYPVHLNQPEEISVDVAAGTVNFTVPPPEVTWSAPTDAFNIAVPSIPVHVAAPEVQFHLADEAPLTEIKVPKSTVQFILEASDVNVIRPETPVAIRVVHGRPSSLCTVLPDGTIGPSCHLTSTMPQQPLESVPETSPASPPAPTVITATQTPQPSSSLFETVDSEPLTYVSVVAANASQSVATEPSSSVSIDSSVFVPVDAEPSSFVFVDSATASSSQTQPISTLSLDYSVHEIEPFEPSSSTYVDSVAASESLVTASEIPPAPAVPPPPPVPPRINPLNPLAAALQLYSSAPSSSGTAAAESGIRPAAPLYDDSSSSGDSTALADLHERSAELAQPQQLSCTELDFYSEYASLFLSSEPLDCPAASYSPRIAWHRMASAVPAFEEVALDLGGSLSSEVLVDVEDDSFGFAARPPVDLGMEDPGETSCDVGFESYVDWS